MKFYDFVNDSVPVLTEIGVSGRVCLKAHTHKKLDKTLSTSWVCAHPYSDCRTLACHMSWVWRHPCFEKSEICPLRAVRRGCGGTHAF